MDNLKDVTKNVMGDRSSPKGTINRIEIELSKIDYLASVVRTGSVRIDEILCLGLPKSVYWRKGERFLMLAFLA